MIETIRWAGNAIRIIDQTQLPLKEVYLTISSVDDLIDAIKKLKIRGAPALGIAGAYGVCLGMSATHQSNKEHFLSATKLSSERIRSSRPTAVNLAHGVDDVMHVCNANQDEPVNVIFSRTLERANALLAEDINSCQKLGEYGASLISDNSNVLTHCNTGGLATGGLGTALGIAVTAHQQKKKIHVYVDETRPLLQGARLTAWELGKEGIAHTLICDNMAGYLMQQKKVDCVIVGADRIAANGDTANKIGTYTLAVLCEKHKVPFYVAAPSSSIDTTIASASHIPIEERDAREITEGFGKRTAPADVRAYNPAFDVTPAALISAIVTENGISYGPLFHFD